MKRRHFLARATAAGALPVLSTATRAAYRGPSIIIGWNKVLTAVIASNSLGPTVAARAISMVYEAAYNAWAAYNWRAEFTLPGLRKRPWWEADDAWRSIAVSNAMADVLKALFPVQGDAVEQALADLTDPPPSGYNFAGAAAQLGQYVARQLLRSRQDDGSNQLGDLAPGAYSDYTGYQPVNGPDLVVDPTRWQPLRITTAAGVTSVQKFLTPQWGKVRPFALASGSVFRPGLGQAAPTQAEMDQLINISANLDDRAKAVVDFFANNPGSVTPPGQWTKFAEIVSAQDGNSLARDVKLFFAIGQAALDASIAAWDAKRAYDSVRPITAIRHYYRGQTIRAWGGPGLGATWIRGEDWKPYQRPSNPSPPFPEFISGHSTFSAAVATVMAGIRGDAADLRFTFAANAVPFDPTVPAAPVDLSWTSLSAIAASAGLSRRLGGIHFERGDLRGRSVGRQVGLSVLARCVDLFNDGGSCN